MSAFSHYEGCPRCIDRGQDSRRDNLGVYRDGSAHCWACGYHRSGSVYKRWASSTTESSSELNNGQKSLLPRDWTREVPADAWQWVMQYGLSWRYWQESVGYSPSTRRLVFQVGGVDKDDQGNLVRTGSLAFSIGRYVGPPTDDKKLRKWHVWGDSHKHAELLRYTRDTSSRQLVLVEDVVSAHKVAQVADCIPLFGTTVHPCHMYALINSNQDVYLWLDKDQEWASKKKALQIGSILGREVSIVVTDKDPKELSVKQIEACLS